MKHFITTAIGIAVSLAFTGCSNDDPSKGGSDGSQNTRTEISLSRSQSEILDKEGEFAFNLLKAAYLDPDCNEADNIFLSPTGVAMNLSMLANGASDAALREILTLLNVGSGELSDLNSLHATLMKELPGIDKKTTLSMAFSMWFNNNLPVADDFIDANSTNFGATANFTDMYSKEAAVAINKWCSDNTNGLVKEIYTDIPATDFSLVNTLYFKGEWTDKFDKKQTADKPFYNYDGTTSTVAMMKNSCNARVATGDNGDMMLKLPFGNGAFTISILLPGKENTLDGCLSSLSKEKWDAIASNSYAASASISLPRFECEYKFIASQLLSKMGLEELFSANDALCRMTPFVAGLKMQQKSKFTVNEEGAEAAAVTWTDGYLSPGPLPNVNFNVERPFIFTIEETSTDAILFTGIIRKL